MRLLTKQMVLASHNRKKAAEMRQILAPVGIELVDLSSYPGAPEPVEDGETFEDNAIIKAKSALAFCGIPALADDSGLAVDALNGEPGVRSARFAGDHVGDVENNLLLLSRLSGLPREKRAAKFVSVIALALPDGTVKTFRGEAHGKILDLARGENGFGYDPLFLSDDLGVTFAEAEADDKNRVSHRGKALAQLADYLSRQPLP